MRKTRRYILLAMIVLVCFSFTACFGIVDLFGADPEVLEPSPVEEESFYEYYGVDKTEYTSFDELVQNISDGEVKTVMEELATSGLEDAVYYTVYMHNDADKNFPIAVIEFKHNGNQYYFSGVMQDNVAFQFSLDAVMRWYNETSGSHMALVPVLDGGVTSCQLSYPDLDASFVLLADTPQPPNDFIDALCAVTNNRYNWIDDDVTYIDGDRISVGYTSYELGGINYRISNEQLLREVASEFEDAYEQVEVFTDDPEEAGADLVTYPASVYLEFEVIGTGETVFELLGTENQTLYSVTIEVDPEYGASIKQDE